MDTKVCANCFVEKNLNEFYIYHTRQTKCNLWCTDCMSARYRMRKYEKLCNSCCQPASLDSNENCKKCNKEAGLYECRECKNLLPLEFGFDGKHRRCKWCMRASRRAKREESRQSLKDANG